MRHISLFIAAALPALAIAQPVTVAPWMTGMRLLRMHAGDGAAVIHDGTGKFTRADLIDYHDSKSREAAAAYLDGVHDATEGKSWCYSTTTRPKPAVIKDAALDALRALPADQLQRNAADLLVQAWADKWPCGVK
jgi:hypothetical protein